MRPPVILAGGVLALMAASGAARAGDLPIRSGLSFDVTPYAGAEAGGRRGGAQPGAQLEVGPAAERKPDLASRLTSIGVRDGAEFGDNGRWYLFAAGSGRAIGLNVDRDPEGLLRSYGWSTDPTAAVGDMQAGVGFRKGAMQTSVGYVHREFRPAYAMKNIDFDNKDDMVALSFSLKGAR